MLFISDEECFFKVDSITFPYFCGDKKNPTVLWLGQMGIGQAVQKLNNWTWPVQWPRVNPTYKLPLFWFSLWSVFLKQPFKNTLNASAAGLGWFMLIRHVRKARPMERDGSLATGHSGLRLGPCMAVDTYYFSKLCLVQLKNVCHLVKFWQPWNWKFLKIMTSLCK